MELKDCNSFVKRVTEQFHQLALDRNYKFDRTPKNQFWIRHPVGVEVLQGNYTARRLRPFMHDLKPHELQQLNQPVPYKNHCRRGDGHRFYIENQRDIDVVKAIVVARCG